MSCHHIEHLIKRNLVFFHRYGYLNALPPANLDVCLISHPTTSLFNTRLFRQDRQNRVPVWSIVQGQISRRHPHLLTSGTGTIALPEGCLTEEELFGRYADTVSVVLLRSDDACSSVLVSEKTFSLSEPFPANYDKAIFLQEYLALSGQEQNAVFWFLSSAGSAQLFHYYVAYLSTMILRKGSLSQWDIIQVLDRSDLPSAPRYSDARFNGLDVMPLLHISGFLSQTGDFLIASALWAILHGVGEWETLAPAEALLASNLGGCPELSMYIQMVCDPWEIPELAKAFTDPRLHSTDPQMCNTILLKLLRIKGAASGETIADINERLFAHSILGLEDIRKLHLIAEDNFALLLDDLFRKVAHSLEKGVGVTDYTKALALAWMLELVVESRMNLKDLFTDAQEMILDGETDAAMLTGMQMLSLLLRHHLNSTKDKESLTLQHAQPILEKLSGWLVNPAGIFYNTAAMLTQELICWGGIDPVPLADPRIKKAASEADRIHSRIMRDLINKLF